MVHVSGYMSAAGRPGTRYVFIPTHCTFRMSHTQIFRDLVPCFSHQMNSMFIPAIGTENER